MKEFDWESLGFLTGGTLYVLMILFLLLLFFCALVMPLIVVLMHAQLAKLLKNQQLMRDEQAKQMQSVLTEARAQTVQLRALVDALRGAEIEKR